MKANEAPEKIYFSAQQQWTNPFIGLMQKCADTDIEYARTNAFIEKACVSLKKLMYDSLMFQGRLHREEVIDNFVETFKKYMKGE